MVLGNLVAPKVQAWGQAETEVVVGAMGVAVEVVVAEIMEMAVMASNVEREEAGALHVVQVTVAEVD